MRIVGREKVTAFILKHADSKNALLTWIAMVEKAVWEKNTDIRGFFGSASFVGDRTVVFNIKGNNYRLVAKVQYTRHVVRILKIGTHAEYDKWSLGG